MFCSARSTGSWPALLETVSTAVEQEGHHGRIAAGPCGLMQGGVAGLVPGGEIGAAVEPLLDGGRSRLFPPVRIVLSTDCSRLVKAPL